MRKEFEPSELSSAAFEIYKRNKYIFTEFRGTFCAYSKRVARVNLIADDMTLEDVENLLINY